MATAVERLKVLSGGAPQHVLGSIMPEIERAVGRQIEIEYALVSRLTERLAAGEAADVVLLPRQLIDTLAGLVAFRSEGRCEIAKVGIGVIVGPGGALPDVSSLETVRALLLAAEKVALPDPSTPSGAHLDLTFGSLGIADLLTRKAIRKGAIHGGGELVARGEADVGFYLVSEIRTVSGIRIAGLLPAPLQSYVVYGSAIPATSRNSAEALAFIRFLCDEACSAHWRDGGFEPVRGA